MGTNLVAAVRLAGHTGHKKFLKTLMVIMVAAVPPKWRVDASAPPCLEEQPAPPSTIFGPIGEINLTPKEKITKIEIQANIKEN